MFKLWKIGGAAAFIITGTVAVITFFETSTHANEARAAIVKRVNKNESAVIKLLNVSCGMAIDLELPTAKEACKK